MPRKTARQQYIPGDIPAELKQVHETIFQMFRATRSLHAAARREEKFAIPPAPAENLGGMRLYRSGASERLRVELGAFIGARSLFRALDKTEAWERAVQALMDASSGPVIGGPADIGSATEFAIRYFDFVESTLRGVVDKPEILTQQVSVVPIELGPTTVMRQYPVDLLGGLMVMDLAGVDIEERLKQEYRTAREKADARKRGCFVTLDKMAAMVQRSKRTLEKLKTRAANPLPKPIVAGGSGKPAEWIWDDVRPWLEREFGKKLPEQYPGDAFQDGRAARI